MIAVALLMIFVIVIASMSDKDCDHVNWTENDNGNNRAIWATSSSSDPAQATSNPKRPCDCSNCICGADFTQEPRCVRRLGITLQFFSFSTVRENLAYFSAEPDLPRECFEQHGPFLPAVGTRPTLYRCPGCQDTAIMKHARSQDELSTNQNWGCKAQQPLELMHSRLRTLSVS